MYIMSEMIDMSQVEWTSSDHRDVASVVMLCNPRVSQLDTLIEGCEIINQIPQDQIRLGIPIGN